MSENDNDGRNDGQGARPAGGDGSARRPLTLQPRSTGSVNAGTVKQSFSHGRSKTVVVETKRRRVDAPAPEKRPAFDVKRPAGPPAQGGGQGSAPSAPPRPQSGGAAGGLSQDELQRRQRVVEAAQAQAQAQREREEAQRQAEQRAQQEARARAEAEQRAQQEARARAEAEARAQAAAAAPPPAAATAPAAPSPAAPEAPAPRARVELAGERAALRPAEPRAADSRPAPVNTAAQRPNVRPSAPTGGYRGDRDRPANPRPPQPREGYAPRPAGDRPGYGDRPQSYGDRPQPASGGYGGRDNRSGGYAGAGDAPRGQRPEGGYQSRGPRPEGGYPPRGPRPEGGYPPRTGGPREGGGGFRSGPGGPRPGGDRGPRPGGAPGGAGGGETVRYSALAPRPPRTGDRPGGPRPPMGARGPAAAPSGPEVTRPTRSGPMGSARPGEARDRARDDEELARRRGAAPAKAVSRTRGEPTRRQGRLTIQAVAGDEDSAERMRSLASVRRAREREKEKRTKGGAAEQARGAREVVIPDVITVQELAQRMAIRGVDVIKFMMRQGMMLKITDVIDSDTAELVATEYGMTVRRVSESDVEQGFISEGGDEGEGAEPRAPVVAVMGHVDHGKTSLLDALRATDVVKGEAGGITQHIGAYQVTTEDGEKVTFLDTPGHAAFSAMRARGANVTDIVILVVAADDGVMPQTVEAIHHARASGAPIIVAVNKIDKPDADPTRVVNELLQHEIVAESLGGETQIVKVSATQKLNLDGLVEAVLLQAEVMDLRANPDRTAEGVVIEAKLDKGRGPVATVLVKRGTLKRGDIVVAGSQWGRVRALINERNEQIPEAGPSEPVEILGLDGAPEPGEALAVVEDEARARELTEYRIRVKRERNMAPAQAGASMADIMAKLTQKKVSELPVVIKADVGGSAEAIAGSLQKLGNEEVRARIITSGVGGITESDVLLAKSAGAPIVGFNVRASKQARDLAEREGVEIRYYSIIYDLLDDMKGVLSGMLTPGQRETFLGYAQVLEVFDITKVGKVAGCRVTDGVVRRGARVRIIRNDVVVLELGVLQTLKRFKDDVAEVGNGFECGMAFQGFQDIQVGDQIECFTLETVARSL